MNEDQIFRAAGLLALFSYLLPMAVSMRPRTARMFRIAALAILGMVMAAAGLLFLEQVR